MHQDGIIPLSIALSTVTVSYQLIDFDISETNRSSNLYSCPEIILSGVLKNCEQPIGSRASLSTLESHITAAFCLFNLLALVEN